MRDPKEEALDALLKNRPKSSPGKLERTIEELKVAVAEEVERDGLTGPSDDVWDEVRSSPSIEGAAKDLLGEVDRSHVLYVYSRFRGSPAVGPPVVESALKEVEKR